MVERCDVSNLPFLFSAVTIAFPGYLNKLQGMLSVYSYFSIHFTAADKSYI